MARGPVRSGGESVDFVELLSDTAKRRRLMACFAALLTLAVILAGLGVALDLPVLTVLALVVLAGVIGGVGKVLVSAAVYLNGTTRRLKVLNDRYDDTEVWLEQFDKGTRTTFANLTKSLREAEKRRESIANLLDEEIEARKASDQQTEKVLATHATRESLEAALKSVEHTTAKLSDAQSKAKESLDKLGSEASALRKAIQEHESVAKEHKSELGSIRGLAQKAAGDADSTLKSLEKQKTELSSRIESLDKSLKEVIDKELKGQATRTKQSIEESLQKIDGVAKAIKNSSSLAGRLRGEGYAQFGRLIGAEFIGQVQGEIGKKLGLDISNRELRYLERKVQHTEALCEGRLATTAEDVVARALAARSRRVDELKVLEIGVLFGVGASFMHIALSPFYKKVRLVLLDPFDGYYGSEHLDPLTGQKVSRGAVERNLRRAAIPIEDVTILEGFSTDKAIQESALNEGPYDVLVIDGDHTYDGIRVDFEQYAQMLAPNGILIIDDYGSEDWPDVTKYVDDVVAKDSRFEHLGTLSRTSIFQRQDTPAKKGSVSTESNSSSKAESPQTESSELPKPKKAAPRAKKATKASSASKPSSRKKSDSQAVVVETRSTRKGTTSSEKKGSGKAPASSSSSNT